MSNLRAFRQRLAVLENTTRGVYARLLLDIRLSAPLMPGTPEYFEAVADPVKFKLAERPICRADEPGPAKPIL